MGPLENSSNSSHYRLNGSKEFLNSLLDFQNSTCFKRPLLKRPPVGFFQTVGTPYKNIDTWELLLQVHMKLSTFSRGSIRNRSFSLELYVNL